MALLFTIIGGGLLAMGLGLDLLSLAWGYTSARGGKYRSGFIVVPAVLYVASILMVARHLSGWWQVLLCVVAVIFHLMCAQLLPALFDRVFARDQRATGASQ